MLSTVYMLYILHVRDFHKNKYGHLGGHTVVKKRGIYAAHATHGD